MKLGIVIVAAGRGERAGSPEEGPKQYRPIGGKAVIEHTLSTFLQWKNASHIVVVRHADDTALLTPVLQRLDAGERVTTVIGGVTRQQSVLAALPVTDTLKRGAGNRVTDTVSRQGLYAAQTPQSFDYADILAAHRTAAASGKSDFTDDASIAEWAGLAVTLTEGSVDNVKLTLKRDIAMADEKLSHAMPDVRTGNGYDVHQLEAGEGVTLCGIFIEHDQKLKGHSDADVALHALTDALLATCGAGDIGDHFPPSDPQWKGAPSRIFLEHAAKVVRDNGGTIMNADVSLIAEAPRIGPHRQAMREALSDMLGISLERCSVKATTNETIGFVGRREGIAAIATATVVYRGRPLLKGSHSRSLLILQQTVSWSRPRKAARAA